MGKGDRRTRRGKLNLGTFGKKRMRKAKLTKGKKSQTAAKKAPARQK